MVRTRAWNLRTWIFSAVALKTISIHPPDQLEDLRTIGIYWSILDDDTERGIGLFTPAIVFCSRGLRVVAY
ncbi:hypothetical protein C8R44DRAFT_769431 [Mycena epipterygia]|nr:hypothetical protein C8R44DRAFT_769431 [Mycena epipterygia]